MSSHAERLDASLARSGEDIILRRVVGAANQVFVDVKCRAKVRGYQPQELVGNIIQGDSLVIISPTEIIRAQWPGGQPITSRPDLTDERVPKNGDKLIVAGKLRNVQTATPFYVAGELVRIEMQARG